MYSRVFPMSGLYFETPLINIKNTDVLVELIGQTDLKYWL